MVQIHSFNLAEHPPDFVSHIGNNSSTTMRRSLASLHIAEGGICEVYWAGFLIRNLAKRLKLNHRCMTTLLLEVARKHSSIVAGLLEVAREHNSVVAVVGKYHLIGIQKYWKQPVEVEQRLRFKEKWSHCPIICV